jgi:hypothetical protein
MYLIAKIANRISKLQAKTFSDLGFKERENLQEWIANNPDALGEEILIIQKEFDGFNDTNERLDLLALDKQGNIIVIENKLDDSGRDVTWQVLKYASYCSTLKKDQIKKIYQGFLDKQGKNENADENLKEFFGVDDLAELSLNSGQTQRIIMIAGNFRKEVTSTVLWLLNYKLRIQCFKATPYQLGDQLFLSIEQIIPMKEAEDYVISMADKAQEDISTQDELKSRHLLRLEFWKELLKEINKQPNSFQNCSPSKDNWISAGSGISGVTFNFVISNYYARTEVYISRNSKEQNKLIFDELLSKKSEIEKTFGENLQWERLDNKKACRIKHELNDVDYFNRDDWNKMIVFMIDSMQRLEKSFRDPIQKLKIKLRTKGAEE